MTVKIDSEKLGQVLQRLCGNVEGRYVESSTWIGEVDGKPVRLVVMDAGYAEEEKYFEGVDEKNRCVGDEEAPQA